MIGKEISRISPLSSSSAAPLNGSNQTTGNLIPTILTIGCIIIVGAIIIHRTQQNIAKSKNNSYNY